MNTTYKYIGLLTLAYLAALAFLSILDGSVTTACWMLPLLLFFVYKFSYSVQCQGDTLVVKNLFGRKKHFSFESLQQVTIHQDPFFYTATLVVRIYQKNGIVKSYHLGLCSVSEKESLMKELKGVSVKDQTQYKTKA